MSAAGHIREHLEFIYGAQEAGPLFEHLMRRLADFRRQHPALKIPLDLNRRVTQADSILITYGDQLQQPGRPPLQSLADFLADHLRGVIGGVHILPFYPYSSDDGFSVIDYKAVDPALGDWPDVARLGQHFRLMFDAVINHVSVQSDWFKGFVRGEAKYAGYFITEAPETDLSSITRPRTLPLLTPVQTARGTEHVWTTFSADQADLNYKNPAVLLEIIDLLLWYVAQGAEFIRLDAIAYLWKEVGTSSIHLPRTHRVIQLFRSVLDVVAPRVMLITETNVPHRENISYFGDGQNEAQMVYQFSLAPLVLHTFYTGQAETLQEWAASLEPLPDTATFFNFTASHDGIGVRPAEGLLTPAQIHALADKTLARRGHVSYKTNPDGSQSPYELNITLFDALSEPDEPEQRQIDRFMASQAIMLALVGVPGIYIHSLVGSGNDYAGVERTGRARSINRQKWQQAELEAQLADPTTRAARVFQRYLALLRARAAHPAFHPNGGQQVIPGQGGLFCLLRTGPAGWERVLCVHNITDRPQQFAVERGPWALRAQWRDLLTGQRLAAGEERLHFGLEPYQVRWLAEVMTTSI